MSNALSGFQGENIKWAILTCRNLFCTVFGTSVTCCMSTVKFSFYHISFLHVLYTTLFPLPTYCHTFFLYSNLHVIKYIVGSSKQMYLSATKHNDRLLKLPLRIRSRKTRESTWTATNRRAWNSWWRKTTLRNRRSGCEKSVRGCARCWRGIWSRYKVCRVRSQIRGTLHVALPLILTLSTITGVLEGYMNPHSWIR